MAGLRALLHGIGKVTVLCAAAPGYIVPRLQALIMNEAARMIEEGLASAEDIDKATRHGLGLRFAAMGVVEFIDDGGVDILCHASRHQASPLSAPRYTAPAVIERMMSEQRQGLRSAEGFHDHRDNDTAAYRRGALQRLLGLVDHLRTHSDPVLAARPPDGATPDPRDPR